MTLWTAYLLGVATPIVIVAVIVGLGMWAVTDDNSLDDAHKLAGE